MTNTLTITVNPSTKSYGTPNPIFTCSYSGFVNGDTSAIVTGLEFSVSATQYSPVGSYTVTPYNATAPGYTIVYVNGTMAITPANATVSAYNQIGLIGRPFPSFTYAINPVGFYGNDFNLISGITITPECTPNSPSGQYPLVITGPATALNYNITYINATINMTLSTIIIEPDNITVMQGQPIPTFTYEAVGAFYYGDTPSYITGMVLSTSATSSSPVGTYTINSSGATALGYNLVFETGTLTIVPAMPILTVTTNNATAVAYAGGTFPPFSVTYSGFVNGQNSSIVTSVKLSTTANSQISPPGAYPINFQSDPIPGYWVEYVIGTLTLTGTPVLNVNIQSTSCVYNGLAPTFTATYSIGNVPYTGNISSIINGLTFVTTAPITGPGVYTINATYTSAPGYNVNINTASLYVQSAPLTITVNNATCYYGTAIPSFSYTATGFVNGDTSALITGLVYNCTATSSSPQGTYPITATSNPVPGYAVSYVAGTLTIAPPIVPTITITTNNATCSYGAAIPTFSATYSGFVNGDTSSVISGLVFNTSATAGSPTGTYNIVPSGAHATGYNIVFVNGTLTIIGAALTITANNASMSQYGTFPAYSVTYSGFVNGDTSSVVSGLVINVPEIVNPTVTNTNLPQPVNYFVGTYPIIPSGAHANQYTISYVNGTLTVNALPILLITINNVTIAAGETIPTLTCTYSGFLNGDTSAIVSGLVLTANVPSNPPPSGSYAISGGGAVAPGYTVVYADGTLDVEFATLTITVNNVSSVYGSALPAFSASYSGFVGTDGPSIVSGLTFSTVAVQGSPVGTYAILPNNAFVLNYNIIYVNGTLTITPASLVIAANNATSVYGHALPTYTATYTGLVNGDTNSVVSGLVLTSTAGSTLNAGTYPIIPSSPTVSNNYNLTYVNGVMTITPAPLTITANNAIMAQGTSLPTFSCTYSGFEYSDTPSVLSGLVITTPATSSSPNGIYSIIPSGAYSPNYTITYVDGSLTVESAILTITVNSVSCVYGTGLPTFTCTYSGFINGDGPSVVSGLTYATSAGAHPSVGTYTITASGATATNYIIQYGASATLTVTKAPLTITGVNASRNYGVANPTFTATYTGLQYTDTSSVVSGLTITSTATTSSSVGTYNIVPANGSASNYSITYVNGTLTINKVPLTITGVNASRTYGSANPTFTATYSGFVNGDTSSVVIGLTITSTATASSVVGTYPITPTGGTATNYTITRVNGTLTVNKAALTITGVNASRNYGATNPTFTVTYAGFVNGDTSSVVSGLTITSTATASSVVGTYPITPASGTATNYTITFVNGTLTIGKAALTITGVNASRNYGAANPTLTATYTGFVNGDTSSVVSGLTLTTTATTSSSVGTYPITPASGTATNYTITYVNGTLTVTQAPLTITGATYNLTFGSAVPTLTATYTGLVNGDTSSVVSGLTLSTTMVATPPTCSPVGTYPVTLSGGTATNYSITLVNGSIIISQAPITVTANNFSRIEYLVNPTFTATITGLQNADNPAIVQNLIFTTTANSSSPVGTYPIVPSGGTASNYSITYVNGTLTVQPQPVLTITAVNATVVYGGALPPFIATYSGFVNGDTQSIVQGLVFTTSAPNNAPVGTYIITPSGATASGYTIVYGSPATLTVTPAPLTITATSTSRSYGVANPTFTVTYNGFLYSDTSSVVSGLTVTSTATTSSSPGTYPITASGGSASNYSITYVNGTLTINKPVLTITANNATRTYGSANPTFTATYSGFVNGDTSSVVSGLTLTATATTTSAVGTYTITASGATAANYTITMVNGTLTVAKAPLVITAGNASRGYGAANPTFTATYSGFVNGDTSSVVSGLSITTTATASSPAGNYYIVPSGASATNYVITYVDGLLTIGKNALTIKANNTTKKFDTPNPAFSATYTGLVNGDTSSVVSGLTITCPATTTTPAGTYTITPANGTATNYTITYQTGILTILPPGNQ